MAARHSVISEATDAGFLGAISVALWYLLYDTILGHPLRTPSVLGQVFLLGESRPDTTHPMFSAIVMYTVVHFALFLLFALLVAWLVRLSVEHTAVRFALVVLFVVFEFFFYVVLNYISTETGALFPGWTVAGANLLAAAVMVFYFWKRYPEIQQALREEPLGA